MCYKGGAGSAALSYYWFLKVKNVLGFSFYETISNLGITERVMQQMRVKKSAHGALSVLRYYK